ncbi:MAG: hypothetical protein A2Y41_00715 [Spirochaetes bacterium GWB1_36_13]|nr:MAG: hypothetical protein A2Y41_00715 [Spirochaetes bacterium GWB1_36_13]
MKIFHSALMIFLILIYLSGFSQEDYSFDPEEYEKSALSYGGFIEMNSSLSFLAKDHAFYFLNYYQDKKSIAINNSFTAQADLQYSVDFFNAYLKVNTELSYDGGEWKEKLNLYNARISLSPFDFLTFKAGKDTLKWGKGYAFNPVAFLDRPKNLDDPEAALEGFTVFITDLTFTFDKDLKVFSLTSVLLPVYESLNSDFGKEDNWNFAFKAYFLLLDTDIDLIALISPSRTNRFGIDFSRNLGSNFEIHGEAAYIFDSPKKTILSTEISDEFQILGGIRYVTEFDLTLFFEYYHNSNGMTQREMEAFYSLVHTGYSNYLASNLDALLIQADTVFKNSFARPNPMKDYFYLKISQKEPFNILYLTSSLTSILNIQDKSFTLSLDLLYILFTNFELNLRGSGFYGTKSSEFAEKTSFYKMEGRVLYYF